MEGISVRADGWGDAKEDAVGEENTADKKAGTGQEWVKGGVENWCGEEVVLLAGWAPSRGWGRRGLGWDVRDVGGREGLLGSGSIWLWRRRSCGGDKVVGVEGGGLGWGDFVDEGCDACGDCR